MNKLTHITLFSVLLSIGCSKDDSIVVENGTPLVKLDSSYTVLKEVDITYADGLSHDASSTTPFAIPLKLDIYSPDNNSENRPAFMWIHGGGFTGGIKHKPDIVEMANYYTSRGWVFISIDYRTTEELGNIQGMSQEEVLSYYRGFAPQQWIETISSQAQSTNNFKKSIAMYMAQRDSKAALRWIVANSNTYNINTDFITVGGNSAGSVSTIALGISNQGDFRDEIPISVDYTLSTTNLNENYSVRSMVYFWGSNAKLDLYEMVYDLEQYDRYDSNDPELFMGHGQAPDPQTPYEEALELQGIYDSLGIYNKLVTLLLPNGDPAGHGAWDAIVDGKGLSELTFEFLTERQNLIVE